MVHCPDPQPLVSCLACTPTELARLTSSDPALLRRWQALPRRILAAGASLLRTGDLADTVWLIEAGLVRFYFLSQNGIERNKSFHAEGAWIAGSMPPLVSASPYTIEALEPSRVVALSYVELRALQREFPLAEPLLADALACVFARQSAREAQLLTQDAAQRYRQFLAEQPTVAARLPLHHVASYLGITNVALSRIRQRLGMGDARRRA
ncbi:Crp/Fnr family transcriptional regulator [Aquabacterium sp. A7-Y]|uniref:Crp/Fnr family transcriptional regulator n=1 Tax=Aquabacterium sp. A7-Y TaxID=1349605 RepID=UPI00223D0D64|nr:Crp/Fnr family transcriptional regulator [Aquabacterium sp. A7-Y]MCW7540982.1 Crp/Fnr family transcriptional regulator [Aquabacterium sp. A7-Y]